MRKLRNLFLLFLVTAPRFIPHESGLTFLFGSAQMSRTIKKEKDTKPTHTSVALASSCATFATKSLLHPIDTTKCRIQHSVGKTLRSLHREYRGKWGPRYLYGGLPVKLLFSVPYQPLYMTTYAAASGALLPDGTASPHSYWVFLGGTIGAACAAELAGCVLRVPMETMKMRLQAGVVLNTAAAFRQMRMHGLHGFRRMVLSQTLLHDIPYSATQWIVYESLRPWTTQLLKNQKSDEQSASGAGPMSRWYSYAQTFLRTVLSGGFSALIASTVTVPLDVMRTRTVVAAAADPNITISAVARDAYRRGGARAFVRGSATRVLWVTSNMAVYFPLFELFTICM
ncbi:mitochondrial carrier protein, putative [Trypanosoma brucei gambiense DAL972]|uniref:Mitochondrial carrier protein, putative n=1 Tax=Trypanosoma brucei gambiense (strain MHOM/CI/86/DAL972) TaxID=679716 RepID=C9ZVC3_TRYB9|nr:mitochondrial carrier protein, putative [Trypanosoma brucei gambiense DAL972]CBH13361.1 mitochondrial carrier protein, putative [Trypanosoma brucei gambiense DAL972]|eukprot:XP_011775638.1 mitochondrial carrier protein, putative [Trypanosoma brucei gambiense DAL972]